MALPVKPHPSNKTDVHEQSTDIHVIYGKVLSYRNPIKTWIVFHMRKQCIPDSLPSFGGGLGTRLILLLTCEVSSRAGSVPLPAQSHFVKSVSFNFLDVSTFSTSRDVHVLKIIVLMHDSMPKVL